MHILIIAAVIGIITIVFVSHIINKRILYKKYIPYINTPEHLECPIDSIEIENGLNYLKTKKVIICSLLRDSSDSLDLNKKNMAKLTSLFKDYKILIVENDSKDDTRSVLLEWAKINPKLTVLGCGVNANECNMNLPPTIIHSRDDKRISKMVMLRNIYQDYIANNADLFIDYDFTIVWDMDIIGTFYVDGIASSGNIFKNMPEVTAICSNGIKITNYGPLTFLTYADPFAHEENKKGSDRLRDSSNFWIVWPETCFANESNLKKVTSCFNGFTIYKKASLDGKKYISKIDNDNGTDSLCEHRTIHEQINGIYINKQMIFVILRQ